MVFLMIFNKIFTVRYALHKSFLFEKREIENTNF